MTGPNGSLVLINQTGISWPNDKGKKFKVLNYTKHQGDGEFLDNAMDQSGE